MKQRLKQHFFAWVGALLVFGTVFELLFAWNTVALNSQANEQKKTVLIDPGHGGEDGGALGVSPEVSEKEINLQISLILRDLFEEAGYNVVMTREGDYAIGDTSLPTISARKVSDIKKRAEICNSLPAGFVLSIHQNHFSDPKYSGAQMFFGAAPGSQALAEAIQKQIVSDTQPQNTRQAKKGEDSIYLVGHVEKPLVIVECGFLSNEEECRKLTEEEYRKALAFSIFLGCQAYQAESQFS